MTAEDILGADLGPAARELIAGLGSPVRAAVLLTPLHASTTPRRSYQLDLEDGRTVKLRRAVSAERARVYVGLVHDLCDRRLARVRAHREDLTIEEWVEGVSLTSVQVEQEHLVAAADLLASLHTADRDSPATLPTEPARATLETDLRLLLDAGAIDVRIEDRLRAAVARDDPGTAEAGVIHTDLCPENLVVDTHGVLRAVDNESLRFGFTGFDLATVSYQWRMTPPDWERYLSAYARVADPGPALRHFTFWSIAAVAKSARIRVIHRAQGAEVPLGRLRSAGGGLPSEAGPSRPSACASDLGETGAAPRLGAAFAFSRPRLGAGSSKRRSRP